MSEVTAILRLQVKEEVSREMAKARGELEKFEKQSNSLRGTAKDLFRELAGPAAGLGAGAALGMLVKGSLEAAASLQALENRARLIYGTAFPRMQQEAEKMGAALG